MAYIFQSVFASEFKNFLIMIRDAGQQTRGYEATFKSLDIFISENPVQGKALTEETIIRWLDSLSCKPQSKNRRITHVRVFSRYLNALEIPGIPHVAAYALWLRAEAWRSTCAALGKCRSRGGNPAH